MFKNRLKKMMKEGETALGIFNMINSPELVEILGISGFDFLVIDTEHGPNSVESAQTLIRAAEYRGMTPVVRATENSRTKILRLLDVGAHGIQVPQVNSREEAEAVVDAVKYFPLGTRGVALTRVADYGNIKALDYFSQANEETLVVAQCENIKGLEALDEIVKVPSVDVVFLGPFDMSQSLGVPGEVYHPKVEEAAARVVSIARKAGKAAGIFVLDGEQARRRAEQGFQYITINAETSLLGNACKKELEVARAR